MAPSPSRQRLPVRKPPAALLSSVPTPPTKAQLRRPRLTAPPASTPPRARPRAPPAPPARPTPLDLRFVAQSLLVTTALRGAPALMPALSLRARLRLVTRRLAAGLSPRTSQRRRPPRLHARRHPATSSPLPRMLLMAPSPSRQRLPVRKPPAALLSSLPTLPTKAQL